MILDDMQRIQAGLYDIKTWIQNRRNGLNKIAEGELMLNSDQFAELQLRNRVIRELVRELADEFLPAHVTRAMAGDTTDDRLDAVRGLPARLQGSYALLASTAFGWHTPEADMKQLGRADGKGVEWRTTTGKEQQGRAAKGVKKFGAGKSVVKNEVAFEKKVAIDKKLRKISIEIEQFLSMTTEELTRNQCSNNRCKKFGDPGWAHCPRCGSKMETRS